ncbi:23S rRNA (adenine(2030)-N(6))-methyltransferase RlmJ [Enhydrobacter sp.]|jgi:23S rRNA (adenine2030-N6)-methyltransferase|uniref:23S rRNA (adenine(2030)-N(6))-methyltransferase RlmJ n=1 Tax=Enhydrobacter sp. TaxID=1894999 RepID=UPI00262EC780|nr:23S rRNA (adenine(2030)-N(6))-methyltransferase RlmJ [Enhydrobacter sp.]WIM09724.1 MAG: 23S rRNA (adenine(2030)-N(6))-methyltransferase [Enhydrobacter sp.]
MNYRHGFHAGNFADVLKHVALVELLRLLTAKDKGLFVLDTHAGAGGYDLVGEQARRTGEAEAGILRLAAADRTGMPPAVARYLAAVAAYDRKFGPPQDALRHYPGSPRLIRAGLRPGDRFVACELHPGAALALKREFAGDRAVEVRHADGYRVLKALLPPPERRGLVLIDPPFEAVDELDRVARALRHGLRRFATGCYAAWYPVKDATAPTLATPPQRTSLVTLDLKLGEAAAPGKLAACGLTVINPPWKFEEAMREALPWVAAHLGRGVSAMVHASPASAPVPARGA